MSTRLYCSIIIRRAKKTLLEEKKKKVFKMWSEHSVLLAHQINLHKFEIKFSVQLDRQAISSKFFTPFIRTPGVHYQIMY